MISKHIPKWDLCKTLNLNNIQSKPVYSNHFFATDNGKNKPIFRKMMRISTKCAIFIDPSIIISMKTPKSYKNLVLE